MTVAQEWICRYIDTQFEKGTVRKIPVGRGNVRVEDMDGKSITFTVNMFGDVMDADTKRIVAQSDVEHNLDKLMKNPLQEPVRWTNCPE